MSPLPGCFYLSHFSLSTVPHSYLKGPLSPRPFSSAVKNRASALPLPPAQILVWKSCPQRASLLPISILAPGARAFSRRVQQLVTGHLLIQRQVCTHGC